MKQILLLFFLAFMVTVLPAQEREQLAMAQHYLNLQGEVCLRIPSGNPKADFQTLNSLVVIDKITDAYFEVYANKSQFEAFLKTGLQFEVLIPASMLRQPVMLTNTRLKDITSWDFYPTYDEYVTLMQDFVNDYPGLCELVNIKTLNSGHKILFIHINNDLSEEQNEPEFMYTASMHGNELTGYVLMLHYIDYLLSNYGTDERVTNLVDNIDVWINPLANPDGTYMGGDNTVYGAKRFNANGVDFNRNFPDPDDGPHPDNKVYQPETMAFMDFADEHHFVMSANLHGGAELINYPWDTWKKLTADDNWWQYVSRAFADTIHLNGANGYFTDLDNGITNGYAWYTISGGRQDYMNYFQHCREATIELSTEKIPQASHLPGYWDYTYRSFLNYMEESAFGVRGVITDSKTGNPLKAKVYIEGHDLDSSCVFSSLPVGDYHRLLKGGTYKITYSAKGYFPKTITVNVTDGKATIQDVKLELKTGVDEQFARLITVYPNPFQNTFIINSPSKIEHLEVISSKGKVVLNQIGISEDIISIDASFLPSGVYFIKLFTKNSVAVKKVVRK